MAAHLRARGRDAVQIGEIGLGRLSDDAIFTRARTENRIVITFDLDFCEIAGIASYGGPGVVLLRLRPVRPAHITARLDAAAIQTGAALDTGASVLVEDMRIRIRTLPAS